MLIHESTFSKEDNENAEAHAHSTSVDAAYIAKQSNSKRLILTHLSTRYGENYTKTILNEAKEIFENTELAHDLETFEIR